MLQLFQNVGNSLLVDKTYISEKLKIQKLAFESLNYMVF